MLYPDFRKRKYRNLFLVVACFFLFGCGDPPPSLEKSIALANENLSAGNTEQAIVLLEGLLKGNPGNPLVLENLAFAYAQNDSHEMAAVYFVQAAESGPDRLHYYLYAAEALRQAGKLRESSEDYQKYLAANPDSPVEWKKLGQLQEELNEPNKAIESFLQSQRLKPRGATAVRLGHLFRRMDNPAQADNWFKVAFEAADGAEGDALLGSLEGALMEENFKEAANIISQLDADHPGLLNSSPLAQSRQDLQKWRAQQIELQRQLQKQERIAQELRERAARREAEAAALAEIRKKEEEEARIIEAARRELPPPPTPANFLNEARNSQNAGDNSGAIKNYWASLKLDDKPAEVWHELSDLLLKNGQTGMAEATAMEAVRREPKSILYTMHYLRVAQTTKTPEELLQELISAKQKIPDSPDITLALARGYKAINSNYREAAILYRDFLDNAPGHPERSKAEAELASLPTN